MRREVCGIRIARHLVKLVALLCKACLFLLGWTGEKAMLTLHVKFSFAFKLQFSLKWLRSWAGWFSLTVFLWPTVSAAGSSVRRTLTFSYVFCLSKKKKKVSLWRGRTWLGEKTLVHKTAVKHISTHRDQENVKKYVLLRTLLATWNLLWRINTTPASFW